MSIIQHIRKSVLGVSQKQFADIAGTTQGTVSRWETGEMNPDLAQLGKIRAYALDLGKEWRDEWLFTAPSSDDAPAAATEAAE